MDEVIRGDLHTVILSNPSVIYLTEGMIPIHPPQAVAAYEAAGRRREGGGVGVSEVIDLDGPSVTAVGARPLAAAGELSSFAVQQAAEYAAREAADAAAHSARRAAAGANDGVAGIGPLPAVMAVRHLQYGACLRSSVTTPGVICLPVVAQTCVCCHGFRKACVTLLGVNLFDRARQIAVGSVSVLCRVDVGLLTSSFLSQVLSGSISPLPSRASLVSLLRTPSVVL